MDVLRITERFVIKGRGTVYTVTKSKNTEVHIGDIYHDLQGRKFELKGIEMLRRLHLEGESVEDMPLGLMFKMLDGVEACGSILTKGTQNISFLFCNHPLYQKKVDEDYEAEYEEARLHYPCALFSYEDLEVGKLSMFGESISGLTIYRGWRMKPKMYSTFYSLLEEKGIYLINSPEEYEKYHVLPGWYDDFWDETIPSIWESEGKLENLQSKTKQMIGSYIVKDYVKSRKHEWYDACFIKDISDNDNFVKILHNFVDRQGDFLTGGLVLRKFIKLKQIGFHEKSGMPISEEYRIFVFAGKILIIDNYWTEKESVRLSNDEIKWIEDIAIRIKSNFVTVDIARKDDGKLIIMEFGDGQVSGLQQIDASKFYQSFEFDDIAPIDKSMSENTVVLTSDPLSDKTVDEIKMNVDTINTTQELVDTFVQVHNKFWFIEDDLYDYKEGSDKYNKLAREVDAWGELMDLLNSRIMKKAQEENLLQEHESNMGTAKRIASFMKKYGYYDGNGWWIKIEKLG